MSDGEKYANLSFYGFVQNNVLYTYNVILYIYTFVRVCVGRGGHVAICTGVYSVRINVYGATLYIHFRVTNFLVFPGTHFSKEKIMFLLFF